MSLIPQKRAKPVEKGAKPRMAEKAAPAVALHLPAVADPPCMPRLAAKVINDQQPVGLEESQRKVTGKGDFFGQ